MVRSISNVSVRRSIIASAALGLSAVMKDQIESRSRSARGVTRHLAIFLHREPLRCQALTSPRLDFLGKRLGIDFPRRSAVEAFLDSGAQPLQLGFAPLFAFFDDPQPIADDLACG